MTFIQFQQKFPTEKDVINYFIKIRYPNGISCPHCHSFQKVSRRTDRPKVCNCNACKNTFSVFAGTIFEKTSTDLRLWFYAIHLFLNAKKGISALQLQREIGTTYKTAWRILKQIRIAMGREKLLFDNLVEVDETYIGGKPRRPNFGTKKVFHKRGRACGKTAVIGVLERATGKVYTRVATPNGEGRKFTGKQLFSVIEAVTKADSIVMTDDFKGYKILDHKDNAKNYSHLAVNHSIGQFSAGNGQHTNGIEGFWAILKRAIIGSYHHISEKYTQSYADECAFRQNHSNENAFDTFLKHCPSNCADYSL